MEFSPCDTGISKTRMVIGSTGSSSQSVLGDHIATGKIQGDSKMATESPTMAQMKSSILCCSALVPAS